MKFVFVTISCLYLIAVVKPSCDSPHLSFNGSCFHYYDDVLYDYPQAQSKCKKDAGRLAVIPNIATFNAIVDWMILLAVWRKKYWIAAETTADSSQRIWYHDAAFTNWGPIDSSVPFDDSGEEDCGLLDIRSEPTIRDRPCTIMRSFICEYRDVCEGTVSPLCPSLSCGEGGTCQMNTDTPWIVPQCLPTKTKFVVKALGMKGKAAIVNMTQLSVKGPGTFKCVRLCVAKAGFCASVSFNFVTGDCQMQTEKFNQENADPEANWDFWDWEK